MENRHSRNMNGGTVCGFAARQSKPAILAKHIHSDIFSVMKPVRFLGDALKCLRDFPEDARQEAGYQLDKVQRGEQPEDFKPMSSIGTGVEEIRVRDETGAYRVIYVARFEEAVFVLHAFQKKTQATAKRDIDVARTRFAQLAKGRK
jgi:phage-related protein